MRNLKNVVLVQMIIHILDCNKIKGEEIAVTAEENANDRTIYSNCPIDLLENTNIRNYFQNRIVEISEDETAGSAVIEKKAKVEIVSQYNQIISHTQSGKFVSASQKMGERLHKMMIEDHRIVPGVIAICLFKASRYSGELLLALLKLDITRAFVVTRKRQGAKNYWVVSLQDFENALPTAGERLQKAVIIRKSKKQEWQMLVLDRQVGKRDGRPAADFFRRYLCAKWKFSPEDRTNMIFGKLIEIANELAESGDSVKLAIADYIYRYIDVSFQAGKINLNEFLEDMQAPIEVKKKIRKKIEDSKLPKQFKIDPSTASKLIKKVRYHGDDELKLIAPLDVYKSMVKEEDIEIGSVPYKQITITTRTWQRIN